MPITGASARGGYRAKSEPVVTGRFIVLANAFDTVAAGNHCGVHKLELWANRELVYSIRFDELEYNGSNNRGGLAFDNRYAYFSPPSYVYNLHNRYSAKNPWQVVSESMGILDFSGKPGPHTLAVKAWDNAGACSTAEIRVKSAAQLPRQTEPPAAHLKAHQDGNTPLIQVWDDFAEVWLPASEGPESDGADIVELVARDARGHNVRLNLVERGETWLSACLAPDGQLHGPISLSIKRTTDGGQLEWRTLGAEVQIVPQSGGVMRADGLMVEFPKDALYSDQIFQVIEAPAKALPGVPVVSGFVRKVLPEGIPLEKEVMVSFDCPIDMPEDDVVRCGVYEYNAKKSKWKYRGNIRTAERSVGYGVRYLSTFGLLVDKAAPQIELLQPKPATRLRSKDNPLVARITDAGSGIDYRTVVATIDGIEIDAEYDPDRKLLKGKFNLNHPQAKHRILIKVSDKAGNPAKPLDLTLH